MSQTILQDWQPSLLAWCQQMSATQPVYYAEQTRSWNVFQYQDVLHVLSDNANYSADTSRLIPMEGPLELFMKGNVANMDPPRHDQLRGLVSQAFTPRSIELLAPRIAELTQQLLDKVADQGKMDIVQDLAYPLPIIVIAEMLGIPIEDRERIKHWSAIFASMTLGEDPTATFPDEEQLQTSINLMQDIYSYLRTYCQERRIHPQHDLISRLTQAEVNGQRLDDDEVVGFAVVLLIAGNITTTLLLGNAMVCLDRNPEQLALLRNNPALLTNALEEVLRCRPPFTVTQRMTTKEVVLHGQTIPELQMVNTWMLAGNYDEHQFSDPERFDIQRNPNRHLSFGHGIHFCIGAPLARLEARIALGTLLQRFPDIRIVPDSQIETFASYAMCGVKSLPVTW